MAVVAPMPITITPTPKQCATTRQHVPPRRVSSEVSVSTTSVAARSCGGGHTTTPSPRQLHSLEDLAASLEWHKLDCVDSPSAAFSYLDGKLYGEDNNSFTFFPKKARSLPSSYFTNCKSTSSLSSKHPLRKVKSVRFADTQGLPLVDIVHQLTHKDSSYTANKIVPYKDEDLLNKFPLIISGPQETSNQKCTTSDEHIKNGSANSRKTSPSTHKHTFAFTQPSLEPDFLDRVKQESVVLESIWEEQRSLHGIVCVSNLGYEKEVVIRWTHDHWKTSHDTCSIFCSNNGCTDRFAFELPLNGDVSFAIRFRSQGTEYWDNNHSMNYNVHSGQ